MVYNIALAGDLHKRPKDITTIKGYTSCCDTVQDSLITMIEDLGITHFISLGDWYDKGYVDDIASALADVSREERMSRMLNGNFYGVIGNHIRLKMDSNPELMLIQPHPIIKSRKPVSRTEQVIKTPDHIIIGGVQISLVHNKPGIESVEEYYIRRVPGVKFHIACVHDSKFIPNSMAEKAGLYASESTNTQLARTLKEVDLCIAGDIHTPLGLFDISPKTKMYVPGSLTNTNAGMKGRHSSINIPILKIDDEAGTYSISFHEFDLHLNMVTFNLKNKSDDKLTTTRGNTLKSLYADDMSTAIATNGSSMPFLLSEFMSSQSYTSCDKKLVSCTVRKPDDINSLIKLFRTSDVLGEEV